MKKFIITIALIFILPICLLFAGCGNASGEENPDFIIVSESHFDGNRVSTILAHKETKVMYCFYKCGYGGGMSIMLNPDGTPMIYEGE